MSMLTVVGASVAAAVLSVGSVAGASVASASPTGSHDNLAARLTAVCGRVGTRIDRVEKVQARLEAGPDTPGSIARLQARIDAATKAGKSDQARLLTDRLAIRKDIESTLPDVLAHLKDAQSVCAAQVGTGTASSPATS